jgi:hypothetical protein
MFQLFVNKSVISPSLRQRVVYKKKQLTYLSVITRQLIRDFLLEVVLFGCTVIQQLSLKLICCYSWIQFRSLLFKRWLQSWRHCIAVVRCQHNDINRRRQCMITLHENITASDRETTQHHNDSTRLTYVTRNRQTVTQTFRHAWWK